MSPKLLFQTRKENIKIYVAKSSLPSLAILQLLSPKMASLLMGFTFMGNKPVCYFLYDGE